MAQWYAPRAKLITGIAGTILIFLAGAAFLERPNNMESVLSRASYDWSFDLTAAMRPDIRDSEVVVVYLDRSDNQSRTNLPRFIDRLTAEGAKAVVLDMDLSDLGPTMSCDEALARSIKRHGKVVLAFEFNSERLPGRAAPTGSDKKFNLIAENASHPASDHESYLKTLREAAAAVGAPLLLKDADFTVRKHTGPEAFAASSLSWAAEIRVPSLAWAAAETVGAPITQKPQKPGTVRWMNYYGGPGTLPNIHYVLEDDFSKTPGKFFQGKIVFVGHQPVGRDEFRNPYSRWSASNGFMPGVEVRATELLNLLRQDWLSRLPSMLEYGLLLLIAAGLGFGLSRIRTLPATIIAGCLVLAFTLIVLVLFTKFQVWFPWMVIVALQMPAGLLWGVLCYSSELYVQRRRLEEERLRATEQIREQAELLDKAQDAIIVHDLDWRASFWNKSAELLYGWTSGEVLGESLSDRILNGEHDKLLDARQSVLRSGEWTGELMQKTKTGSHVLVQSRWSLVRDAVGQPRSILVINTDITDKKRLESQFLRAQRMESIGTLAGGIAHDLNNVLSPILIGVELLQLKLQDDNSQKLLATMSSSAKRGADLVKQVLTFARGHDGERAPLQLTHLLKEMHKILRDTFPKSIEVKVDIDPNLSVVSGDATQLHQVLLNLCVNARDAMPDGGKLVLEAENYDLGEDDAKRLLGACPGSYVRLRVTDTGTGIPPEIQDKIFEPFFTTKQLGKGTGLGLSTVMSIVKSHGGLVELHSTPGQGTCFEIILPSLGATAVVPAIEQPGEIATGGSECVLVIDDETAILEVIRTVLTQNGYRVLVAHHGADAVALCLRTSEPIHLVITDMMMPVMDGPRAMRALRELRPELRFIAMSGLQQSEQIREQIGDATFVPKPFSGDRLLRVVREVLSNRGGETRFYRRSFGPGFATELRTRFEPMKA